MKCWWNRIQIRVMGVLLLMAMGMIGVQALGTYFVYQESFLRELSGSRTDVLRQIAERSRQFKTSLYTLSNLFQSNPEFRMQAQQLSLAGREDFTQFMDQTTLQLQRSFLQPALDFYVVYLSTSGIGYCSWPVPPDYDYMDPRLKVWNHKIVAAQGEIVDIASYQDRALQMAVFSAARTILNSEGEMVGFLMINADERQLYRMYDDVMREESHIYITNSAGQIISSSQSHLIGFHYFSPNNLEELFQGRDYRITQAGGRDVLFTRYHDGASGFTVYEEAPLSQVLRPLKAIQRVVLTVALVVFLLGIFLAREIARRLAAPIQRLRDDLKQVERGDLYQSFPMHSYTEVNELAQGMRDMLTCIRGLIVSIQEHEEQKRHMEWNWLQAQMNPHFIYNTLFSIRCMVELYRNEDAAQMLTTFIQILQGILSNAQEMVTVAQEMETLQSYLTLWHYRYEHTFDVLMEWDHEAEGCYLPQLMIQPLVENAVEHGLSQQGYRGTVTVIVRRQGEALWITVEDDGVGISSQRLQQVMEGAGERARPHLGLRNIRDRIQLHYGSRWGLEVDSVLGRGTCVTLRVPAREEP